MAKIQTEVVVNQVSAEEEAKRARARARRAAKRGGGIEGELECQLCKREGKTYRANSLITHLKQVHGLDGSGYDLAMGVPLGTMDVTAPSLIEKYREAGRKGAAQLKANKADQTIDNADIDDTDVDEQ